MRVMILVKASSGSEAGEMPSEQLLADMGKFNEELVAAGIMKAGEGLRPSSEGMRVHFSGTSRTVSDGPFAETKELVAGFWLWEVASIDEALKWVKRCPNPMLEDSDIEIRPLYEMEDFAEADPTGEHATREDALRETLTHNDSCGKDEQAILALMANWRAALECKDISAMLQDYQPDAVLFDACPPYKVEGVEAIRKTWEACLPYFPEEFKSVHQDVVIQVGGDTAFVYGLHHFEPNPADHPCGQSWMRISIGLVRVAGKWKVAHEHCSLPFNPMNNQVCFVTDPEKLEMPDYSQASDEGATA